VNEDCFRKEEEEKKEKGGLKKSYLQNQEWGQMTR